MQTAMPGQAASASSISSRTMTDHRSPSPPLDQQRRQQNGTASVPAAATAEKRPGPPASPPSAPNHFRVVFSQSLVTDAVSNHHYKGSGTDQDPYLVEFIPHDPRNPMLFSAIKKWSLTVLVGFATLAVSFNSSAYSGGIAQVIGEFHVSVEVATLGISLFVLGFAIGPLFWGPMSELYGRQILFAITYAVLTAFNGGAGGAQNPATLSILRFFAGAFGSSPLTMAGGVMADMFPPKERGLAMACFAIAPFMGPALGPVVGGFVGQSIGWRWLEGIMAIFSGILWILMIFFLPETYAPVILRRRAEKLTKVTGNVYISKLEAKPGVGAAAAKPSVLHTFKTALSRPWVLLFREPIVFITTVYMAIIYGTLYMMFAAFPIVFQQRRGWSEGIGGLAFIGVAVGFLIALAYIIPDNRRYARLVERAIERGEHSAPPEARLPPAMIGAVLLPIGLFWFAFTNDPSIHWIVSILAGIPFGGAMVLVFLSILNYLIDSYTVYAASVLAANSILRSLFGAAFPLFTTHMYDNLGIHWASSIPAFLALACAPFPFLFYKYGASIRRKCRYSKQAEDIMIRIRTAEHVNDDGKEEEDDNKDEDVEEDVGVKSGSSSNDGIAEKNARSITLDATTGLGENDRDVDLEKGLNADKPRRSVEKKSAAASVKSEGARTEAGYPDIPLPPPPPMSDEQDLERVRTGGSVPY